MMCQNYLAAQRNYDLTGQRVLRYQTCVKTNTVTAIVATKIVTSAGHIDKLTDLSSRRHRETEVNTFVHSHFTCADCRLYSIRYT